MKTEIWNTIESIHVTADQIREALEWNRAQPPGQILRTCQLDLPKPEEVTGLIRLEDLLTPLDASTLSGYRHVQIPEGSHAPWAEIYRRDGQITFKHVFRSEKHSVPFAVRDRVSELTSQLLSQIEIRFHPLVVCPGFVPEPYFRKIAYTEKLVSNLLIKTLVDPQPPEIVPKLISPSAEQVFKAVGDLTPLSWEYVSDHFVTLEHEGHQYVAKARGERGGVSIIASGPELPEVTFLFIQWLFFEPSIRYFMPESSLARG